MLGAIIGDVIGSWYEGKPTKSLDFKIFNDLCRPTDDSIMTIAAAEAILETEGSKLDNHYEATMRKWGTLYPRAGYGGNFRKWLHDPDAGPYKSWGNGSAMRVSPVGWAFDDEETVLSQAALSAAPTHNHPEGIKGAQSVAVAILMARQGQGKNEIRRRIAELFGYDMNRRIDTIRPDYEFEVSCMLSVPESIIAFLDSSDFETAIRNAISLGGDADTQAAIAGSIAEAFYGQLPDKLMSFVLPRLPRDVLDVCISFSGKYLSPETTHALEEEKSLRPESDSYGYNSRSSLYKVLMSAETRRSISDYTAEFYESTVEPGDRLKRVTSKWPKRRVTGDMMTQFLITTKKPCIFAESQVAADGSDWTGRELSILGDISIAVPVRIYDDGLHVGAKIHKRPLNGTLLYVPGALLTQGRSQKPVDSEVISNGEIDPEAFYRLYERRLLPVLKYSALLAKARNHRALVTVPGLGCGQFAGKFRGQLQVQLRDVLIRLLNKHQDELSGLAALWYDPYKNCPASRDRIGEIDFFVRPLGGNGVIRPQLCEPSLYAEEGDDFTDCELFSVVAWDHVSWPGNDFWQGDRSTDDGVKAAATDSMFVMTGIRGKYDLITNKYEPPGEYSHWEDVIIKKNLQLYLK